MQSVNPFSGQVLAEHPEHTAEQVESLLVTAARAQAAWRGRSFDERARVLRRIGELFGERSGVLGELATAEMGKPLRQAEAEAAKCGLVCDFYADEAADMLADEAATAESHVRFDPLGLVLAVMPWNFPFWQVMRFAAPALMAGNGLVVKHAPNTLGVGKAIVELCREAGLPEGLLSLVVVDVDRVPGLIHDPRIAAVTVTGSERAGAAVASQAGAALKKCVLELGGSDPFIVLDDADLDAVIPAAVMARVQNNGQSCCAAKRFLVEKGVAAEFTSRFVAAMSALTVGDPAGCDVGPLARPDLAVELERQVAASVAAGARVLCGGERDGSFYPPTVLVDVAPGMPAYEDELFGPVAVVIEVADEDEAVAVANASAYGLAASVWASSARGRSLAPRLDVGGVFVNRFPFSDPRIPFGGVKKSGYGRELGRYGLLEFVNIKTVWAE
ncbi:MAG: NAD-dependent succinate-semialdehyde dehydrogenase [Proteobacteria bacterium]|nr:NAD-dependent succinate-semialdehyde dehydrogenase [Pseudomonadota bacterium]MCP4921171.1 NAD-dependent succinate-semialdehyde dehydrogenase [Pseudomonadota bacterium]